MIRSKRNTLRKNHHTGVYHAIISGTMIFNTPFFPILQNFIRWYLF